MDHVYDMRRWRCPLPVLKVHRRLRDLPEGGRVVVICSDPSAEEDFRQYCARTGHRFVSCRHRDGAARLTLDIRPQGKA